MYEYQIVVQRISNQFMYTAYKRRWAKLLPISLWWEAITPMYQETYDKAQSLIDMHKLKTNQFKINK